MDCKSGQMYNIDGNNFILINRFKKDLIVELVGFNE